MSHVLVPLAELEVILTVIGAPDGVPITTGERSLALAYSANLWDRIDRAKRPFGIRPGEKLLAPDRERRPVYALAFDNPRWLDANLACAYELADAVEKAAPYARLSEGQDPLFYDRAGYWSGVLDYLTARGFDTFHDTERGFAVYAPRRPVPVVGRTFQKVASNAPRPS